MDETRTGIKNPKSPSVLITGGSGLIGKYLTSRLLSEGFRVSHLSRNASQFGMIRVFRWNPEKNILDPLVFEGVDYIIHLAGANIGEKRWTSKRKKEIINSRVHSANLLFKTIADNALNLKAFISASAVGYYGSLTTDRIFRENDPPAEDFLGATCRLWEEAADQFSDTGVRVVKIRTAVVLEKNDSALVKFLKPAKFGIFPILGLGRQYMPWIHIKDLCDIYLKAVRDNKMEGAFNAVSSQHVNHKDFMKALAKATKKRFFHFPVPSVLIKMALGQMSDIVLKGSRVSSEKILKTGLRFRFDNINDALNDTLGN